MTSRLRRKHQTTPPNFRGRTTTLVDRAYALAAALAVPLAASAALAADGTWAPSKASRSSQSNIAVSATSVDVASTEVSSPATTNLKWGHVRGARAAALVNPAAVAKSDKTTKPIFAKPAGKVTLTAAQADEEDDLFKAPSNTRPKPSGKTEPDPFDDDLAPKKPEPEEAPPELMDEPEPMPKSETIPEPEFEPEPPPKKPTPPRTPTPQPQPKQPRPAPPRSSGGFARPRAAAPLGELEDCDTAKKRMLANRLSNIGLDIRVTGAQGTEIPPECDLDAGHYAARSWCETTVLWKASSLCHKPLYFEDVQLERYGHDWGPVLQPVVSGVHFFGTLPILPYKMGLQTPNECVYALGYYRPGSCAPYMIDPIPFTWRAALFEAGAWVGGAAAIP